MTLFNLSAILFLISYCYLKWKHPTDRPWPYIKTFWGAVAISSLPVAASTMMIVYALVYDSPLYGIPRINLVSFSTIVALGLALHGLLILTERAAKEYIIQLIDSGPADGDDDDEVQELLKVDAGDADV